MSKRCYSCGYARPLDQFCSDRSRPDGRNNLCRSCAAKRKNRGRGIPSSRPDYRRAKRHGLTVEQLTALLANGCGACGSTGGLVIDHDHSCCPGIGSCGRCVRGVLCGEHNLALGKLGDNLEGVMRLVGYLQCSPSVKR